jgi:hypothetical protein
VTALRDTFGGLFRLQGRLSLDQDFRPQSLNLLAGGRQLKNFSSGTLSLGVN